MAILKKTANLAKTATMAKIRQKVSKKSNEITNGSYESCNYEFGKNMNIADIRRKSNIMILQRASFKVAILKEMWNLVKIRQCHYNRSMI